MPDPYRAIHPFERSGLGCAPFRFIGMQEKVYQACPGAPVQPGGTCDHCGQGIRYVFYVKSSDGKTAGVGCDCISKTHHKGERLLSDAQKVKRDLQRKQRQERAAAKVADARQFLADNPNFLADQPHPNEYWAKQGQTHRDAIVWLLDHAGQSGQMRACAAIKKLKGVWS